MFNFVEIYSFIHVNGCVGRGPSALLCPEAYNAVKMALMHCKRKLKLRSHNTNYCLLEVVTTIGLTVPWHFNIVIWYTGRSSYQKNLPTLSLKSLKQCLLISSKLVIIWRAKLVMMTIFLLYWSPLYFLVNFIDFGVFSPVTAIYVLAIVLIFSTPVKSSIDNSYK